MSYYYDENGELVKKKKKKEQKQSKANYSYENGELVKTTTDDDIAPVKTTTKKEKKRTWFQKGGLEDGFSVKNATKTAIASGADLKANVGGGLLEIGEKVADALLYVGGAAAKAAPISSAYKDLYANETQKLIAKDLYDGEKVANFILNGGNNLALKALGEDNYEDASVFGEKTDALAQSGGQLIGTVALQAVGVPWFVTTGVTSFGGEVEQAFNEGATYTEAGLSGAIQAGADILTEKMFGGSGLGEKGLINLQPLTRGISRKVVKTLVDFGIDMAAEGSEEVVAGIASNLGKALYKEGNLKDIVFSEEAIDEYVESFVGGAVLGGGMNSVKAGRSVINKTDYHTGLTANDQKVFDKVYDDLLAEAEQNGEKLTKKDKEKIYNELLEDVEKGYISTDTIEEVLGGESYDAYKTALDEDVARKQGLDALKQEYDELYKMKNGEKSDEQIDRQAYLKKRIEEISKTGIAPELKTNLSNEVYNLVKDSKLGESYNEKARRGQAFQADLSQYSEEEQATIKKAVESGYLNNTRRTHEFVDLLARVSADKGVPFDFTNNEKIAKSIFAVDGKTVNAYVTESGITLNMDSPKYMNSVVGHEITHILEGTELYGELSKAAIEYAKTKGEYNSRIEALNKLYKNVKGANIEAELTADLVGDYLFTDRDFVRKLSTENRNVFDTIFEEIKYLCKVATAGSKEARQLEKVKKTFEEAYRESGKVQKNTAENSGVKHSLEEIDGTYYVKTEKNTFIKEDGTLKTEREVFNSLVGKPIPLPDGEVKIVKRLPDKDMYDELYRRHPKYRNNIQDVKKLNSEVNYNMEELLSNSEIKKANAPDENNRHAEQGIVDFDTRTVKFYDGEKAYTIEISIGNLQNGEKVAYAKKFFGYDAELTKKIQTAESRRSANAPFNQRSVSEDIVTENAKDVKTQYSLSADSEGNKLSKEQSDYFKDSKVVDENGGLKVVYHGTRNADFTIFKKNVNFFTDSKEMADSYSPNGEMFEGYLNITKPYELDAKGEKWSKIPIDEATKNFLQEYGAGVFKEGGKWRTTPADIASAIEEAVDNGDMDYDGIIIKNIDDTGSYYKGKDKHLATDYIVFNSNQFKNVDNKTPTDNPDIRFSLSEPIEYTKDLIAVHNLSEEKLAKSLKLGGLPMPSIAIARAKEGFSGFGNISLVFGKETIDPQFFRSNKVYSGDAWTPTYPRVEYEVSDKAQAKIEDKINSLVPGSVLRDLGGLHIDSNNLESELNRHGGNIAEVFRYNTAMKYAFLVDSGTQIELPTQNKRLAKYSNHSDKAIIRVAKTVPKEKLRGILREYTHEQVYEVEPEIRKALNEYLQEEYKNLPEKAKEILLKKNAMARGDIDSYAQEALDYLENGIVQEVDYSASRKLIDEAIDTQKYETWVKDLFANIVQNEGIRNNKDLFTPSGNRRSFNALHYEHNLENVIRAMKEDGEKGIGWGAGGLFGASTTEYNSIADIKDASKTRLQNMSQEEYDAIRKEFSNRFFELAYSMPIHKDSFTATDDATNMLTEAVSKFKTKSGMANYIRKESQGWANYSDNVVDDLIELVNDIRNMPTQYFEAKPQRAVGFDEVTTAIIPDNSSAELKQMLANNGINFVEYESGNEQARIEALNSLENVKFSLLEQGETPKKYGNYNVSGKDIRLETQEEIAPTKTVAKESTETEDYSPAVYDAPITEEEANALASESLESLDDADAPLEVEEEYYNIPDTTSLDKKTLQNIGKSLRETLSLTPKETKAIQDIVQEYSTTEFPSNEELFETIQAQFSEKIWKDKNEAVAEVKRWLRKTKINVSPKVKQGIDDYSNFRKSHSGKIGFSKEGIAVDSAYQELNELFPDFFPADIANEADQLLRMGDVADLEIYTENSYRLDDDTIQEAVNIISNEVRAYKDNLTQTAAEETAREDLDDIAPAKATQIAEGMTSDANLVQSLENHPIKTVKERETEKLRAVESELADNKQLRREAEADYNAEIARLQEEYAALKDKNTQKANNIIRRVVRLERLKATVDADYAKRISDLEARAEKMNSATYQTAVQRKSKMQEYTEQMETLVGDTSTWQDKKMGISYKVNTLRRNLRDIVRDENGNRDIAKADAIYEELQGKYNHNEASLNREANQIKKVYADLKITKAENEYIQMLGELRHNPNTTLTEDAVNEFYEKNKRNIDEKKVDKAIELARQTYDSLLERVNNVLREQGMKEIPYRKGYFPHFTEEKQGFLAKLFNWKTQNNEIPTDIAGLTENFNPERSWQSFNKERKGDTTDYNFEKGLDTYVQGALDWIYHIEDIQKRRAFENHIRYIHSEKGVQEKIEAIRNNEEYDADEAQAQIDLVYKEAGNPLNNFVTDFRTATNTLAGKKSSLDRTTEEYTNRKIYSVMTNIQNRMSANMIAGSVSSALTNFIPITQSWAQVSPVSSLRAMGETIKSTIRDDGTIDKSDFLTNRLKKSENLYQTTWDKVIDKAGILMESVDSFTSQVVWRSKYNENISKGMSENEAIKNADQFAENVLAGRSRGNQPTLFDAKNPLAKTFTLFQLEVNNQYGYMFKDVPQDVKAETKHWKANLTKGYVTMFLGAYAYNALYSSLVGRDAAFDPIGIVEDLLRDLGLFGDDEEEEPADTILNLADNILEEVPFVGGMLGGGRIPISSALPYDGVYEMFSGTVEDIGNKDWANLTNEWLNPLTYLALPAGGGQIKKTMQGLSMFNTNEDHPIAGSYTNSGDLRFPVDDTLGNRIQAGIFGQWANENARDYIENGRKPLNEKQIQEFIDVDIPIKDYWEYREGLKGLDKLEEKINYIDSLDLPLSKKNILVNNIVDRKEDIDLENYSDFSSLEEFDFATKYPEKYSFFQENGISYADYESADEDGKRAYTWAFENPEKYTLSKAVADDVIEYRSYTSDLYDIRADKDENGDTIIGSGKEKKLDYINNLDNLEYGQKIILFKSLYNADDTYNYDIIDYLNEREDISYDEMVTILKELDFEVDEDGNIYWD